MTRYSIDKQWIVAMKTGDLSDKRTFLSDKSKNNCVLLLCYSRVFITFATGYCFLRENGNDCLTKNLLQILNDYFVCLVDIVDASMVARYICVVAMESWPGASEMTLTGTFFDKVFDIRIRFMPKSTLRKNMLLPDLHALNYTEGYGKLKSEPCNRTEILHFGKSLMVVLVVTHIFVTFSVFPLCSNYRTK